MSKPFLIVNPKAYLFGNALLELAQGTDKIAENKSVTVYFTCPFTELSRINENTKNLIVTSQHMDAIHPGRGMGQVSAESLIDLGIAATFLNHAEYPLSLGTLNTTIERAHVNNIATIVCANSVNEAMAIAALNPTIVLAEPTHLIGTGHLPNDEYIKTTISKIRKVNSEILVMIASGVSSSADVRRVMKLGADGTGGTSGIIKKDNPIAEIALWIEAISEVGKIKNDTL